MKSPGSAGVLACLLSRKAVYEARRQRRLRSRDFMMNLHVALRRPERMKARHVVTNLFVTALRRPERMKARHVVTNLFVTALRRPERMKARHVVTNLFVTAP